MLFQVRLEHVDASQVEVQIRLDLTDNHVGGLLYDSYVLLEALIDPLIAKRFQDLVCTLQWGEHVVRKGLCYHLDSFVLCLKIEILPKLAQILELHKKAILAVKDYRVGLYLDEHVALLCIFNSIGKRNSCELALDVLGV